MFSRRYFDGGDEREMSLKRPRLHDSGSSVYGGSPSSGFMYSSSYGYGGVPPPLPVVRLRGLPFDCIEVDIFNFFRGLDIVDILFVHKNGKFNGDAFCVLAFPLQVDFALQRNRQNMGRRYIEVFRSKRQEYYNAVANEVSDAKVSSPRHTAPRARSYENGQDSAYHTRVLRLRGLPFSAGKEDVLDFFKEFDVSEDSVHIILNPDGRSTGEAFVEFGSAEESKSAMAKDRMTIGSRYIELFTSTPKEMDEAITRGR